MSECPQCHRWFPPDNETGYDADGLCPVCEEEEDAWRADLYQKLTRLDFLTVEWDEP
jgi:hypothetical protein